METSLTVRVTALCASAVITLTLLQAVALLGHPHHAVGGQLAQCASQAAPAR
ncbi:hypothetical protein ACPWT1_22350 [Ramlibacter sp. MMS24-I3-19]|uniref:hypothetical protein n=1 Tax=Ramlibacter sp. MMS24-I3-19 TaxID=3416606 RepID=UPI003D03CC1B